LIEDAELTPQDVVLISAASSSVGLAAIQLANLAGAMTRTSAIRRFIVTDSG
jgi:NADPH:quinone reductase-like Zn-dependent oxidoreductase